MVLAFVAHEVNLSRSLKTYKSKKHGNKSI